MPAYTKPPGSNKRSAPHSIDVLIGRKIQARRLQLGLTIGALANKARISGQLLSAYEQATFHIPVWRLWQIAKALDCPIGEFFKDLEIGGDHDAR